MKGEWRRRGGLLLLWGRQRFERPNPAAEATLAAITDLKRLEQLCDNLLDCRLWTQWLNTLPRGGRKKSQKARSYMAHQHSPRFLQLVKDAKKRVQETTVDEVKARLDRGEKLQLIDVREESEYAKDHLPGAVHLGKGIIERDVEQRFPDAAAEIILYCGGGFRSALAADNLQKMGYTKVISMDGGVRGWRDKGHPMTKD